jgi:hypothetical protein
VTLSCEIQAANLGWPVDMIEVLYELLYDTVLPGASQLRSTTRPGAESGTERLCETAGKVLSPGTDEYERPVAFGLFVTLSIGKIGNSMRGFDAGHSTRYGERSVL